MTVLQAFAPVKVNLCLHVGAPRADGLHPLASLTAYPQIGDVLQVRPAQDLSLALQGPFAANLQDLAPEQNLILKAARLLQHQTGTQQGAHFVLDKIVPPASGIGGGTADGAAAFVLLRELWGLVLSDAQLMALAFQFGADGPACLLPHLSGADTGIMTGAGEEVVPGPTLFSGAMCLINPLQDVPTGQVFQIYDQQAGRPVVPHLPDIRTIRDEADFGRLLATTRNDLQGPALSLCPEIAIVLDFMNDARHCMGARMSGSGATCFGVYPDLATAEQVAQAAREKGWWSASGLLKGANRGNRLS